jgi:mannose-6-phosphate isomerase-like protein (cupin superfamily)
MDTIKQVAERLRGLRDALDLTREEIAAACGIPTQLYTDYESGVCDIPVSFLHRLSDAYNVELTALLFDEEPKMQSYYVTRAGHGMKVERTAAYSYQDIAAGFAHREMAPFIVTVEPQDPDTPTTVNTHHGQELNYVLEGQMEITVDGHTTVLNPGDSIMFDANRPHGMRTVGNKTVKFLAIIS